MKHAFMIMAHNNWLVLERLIEVLDDERVDIYLHIDKKVRNFDFSKFQAIPQKANLKIYSKHKIFWGGYSQVKTEMFLLNEALKPRHDYYHLLSGQDFCLKGIDDIDSFFLQRKGQEFISYHEANEYKISRTKYYYLWNDCDLKNKPIIVQKVIYKLNMYVLKLQKLGVDRDNTDKRTCYTGSNWFSITESLAKYVIANKKYISKRYKYTVCADEAFIPTLVVNSSYKDKITNDNQRLIDWQRGQHGSPYTFSMEDYDLLMNSGKLFARKFSDDCIDLVDKIRDSV